MEAVNDFPWPKELHAVKRAAEEGTLTARTLYPIEIRALCNLVADIPLNASPREIAPGMSVAERKEERESAVGNECRSAYYFVKRFENGRVWQCSLFTEWLWGQYAKRSKVHSLKPRNIVQGLTRSIAAERGQ